MLHTNVLLMCDFEWVITRTYQLFLTAPAAKCCSVADIRSGGFFGSRLHQLPPRLLQCLAIRHCKRPTAVTAISSECSCASGDWNPAHRPHYAGSPVTSLAAGATTHHFQVGDTGSQVLEWPSTWLSGRRLPSCWPQSSWFMVSRQHDAGHPSYDDVTGRQSICCRRTACLEQPSSCHPWSITVVVNLRKAAENLYVCLRVTALVTYELAPWKCTD